MTGALDFLHGLDDAEDRFEELSRQLVNNFFVLLRSATMHDLGNEAMRRPVAAMVSTAWPCSPTATRSCWPCATATSSSTAAW